MYFRFQDLGCEEGLGPSEVPHTVVRIMRVDICSIVSVVNFEEREETSCFLKHA